MERGYRLAFFFLRDGRPSACRLYFWAQELALRHSTTPSITFERPSSNLLASTTSFDATASINPIAEEAKDMAADFLSLELEWPKSASVTVVVCGPEARTMCVVSRSEIRQ